MSKRPCPNCSKPMDRNSKRCLDCSNYGKKRSLTRGYVRLWMPEHPMAGADGYALEHRVVLYEAGVAIPEGAHVHHINEDKQDNRLANLAVLGASEHVGGHVRRAGEVVNQFGTWPLLTDAERKEKVRIRNARRYA